MAGTFDLTFRTDSAGNMVKGRRGEYVCNIVQMLFAMIPGSDPYEPEKDWQFSSISINHISSGQEMLVMNLKFVNNF